MYNMPILEGTMFGCYFSYLISRFLFDVILFNGNRLRQNYTTYMIAHDSTKYFCPQRARKIILTDTT